MDERPTSAPGASARDIALYLGELKVLVDRATKVRQAWIREIGGVTQAFKTDEPTAALQAGVIGREQLVRFAGFRDELAKLVPPPPCEACHLAVVSWLDKQIAACEVMVEVGQTGNGELMRGTTGLLSEGRIDTMRYRAEYTHLVAALNDHLKTRKARKPRRPRWPFGARRAAGVA